jgi:hypothetical protein
MSSLLRFCVLPLLLGVSSLGFAAPTKIDLEYAATRNGQPFATVTETFRIQNGRYMIESVTAGIGVYALFGKRRLTSEGEVVADGLKPSHFELHQGDKAKKSLFADFDWSAGKLTMLVKGSPVTVDLAPEAQDLASFSYQFMYSPPKGELYSLPVTTGKKLRDYHYKVIGREELEIDGRKVRTIRLADADAASEDSKELWLDIDRYYLPVRLEMRDDNGMKIEQVLTTIHVE